MEVYQLFIPENSGQSRESSQKASVTLQMAKLIKAKKSELRKNMDDIMTDLIMKINKMN